jgi:hypothetical protein
MTSASGSSDRPDHKAIEDQRRTYRSRNGSGPPLSRRAHAASGRQSNKPAEVDGPFNNANADK